METLTKKGRALRRKFPRNNQKGFTLIEMLVVISILGILAAIVTISMVGVTKIAQDNANKAEVKTVQASLDTMLSQQKVDATLVCNGWSAANATTNMDIFPVATGSATGGQPLHSAYIHEAATHNHYWCDTQGAVHSPDVQGS